MRILEVTLLAVGIVPACMGAVIHVPAEAPTIQAGINAAANGDEVVLADGVYTGSGNVNLNYEGKSIIVRSAGGAGQCIIDCQGGSGQLRRAVRFISGEGPDAVFQAITVRNGFAKADGSIGRGGAILALDSSPTIRQCIFEDNQADDGGAIAANQQTLIDDCLFRNNQATIGGAVFVQNACTVKDSLFQGNEALLGGAVLSEGSNTILGCVFLRNIGGSGGTILVNEDGTRIIGCLLAMNAGDAIRAELCDVSVTGCTIADQLSGRGIILLEGSLEASNSVIANCLLGSIVLADGAVAAVSHSLVEGGWPGEGNIDEDPQFIASVFDNPHSQLYRVRPTSPCIDAGGNSLVPAGLTSDLDGYPRILDGDIPPDGNAVVDIGCYERVHSRFQINPPPLS